MRIGSGAAAEDKVGRRAVVEVHVGPCRRSGAGDAGLDFMVDLASSAVSMVTIVSAPSGTPEVTCGFAGPLTFDLAGFQRSTLATHMMPCQRQRLHGSLPLYFNLVRRHGRQAWRAGRVACL